MGFFDGLKKAFDTGGIDVGLVAPKSFRWSDGTLPLTVILAGHQDEPRTVAALEVWLREDDEDSQDRRRGHREGVRMTVHGPFALAPGEVREVEIPFALSAASGVETASGEEAPAWLKAVSGAANALTEITRDTPWYRLSVEATVEGAGARKMTAHRIKNNRAGEWGDGQFGGSISIG
ncbi:MAG TPA: hypothetical protein VFT01_11410 [Homoserinimonas sp.]|nr:hypothetical protein [Homoserinimonas sp.]